MVPAFPDPGITGLDRLTLGQSSTLTCQVSGLFPDEHRLSFTWFRGDTVIQHDDGPGQSEYQFTPQEQDVGGNISCRATLDLKDLPAEDKTRETTVQLNVHCES